jgi:hypothetical protein
MLASARRYILIIALLLASVGLTWGQRLSSATRLSTEPSPPADDSQHLTTLAVEYVYFIDVEGWYRITPYETVVRSPYDLTAESTEAMADAIPGTLGEWQQVGRDEYLADDPAIVRYLKHPPVALQRSYRDPSGQRLALVIIGNKGKDSFLLFSHTPETCYPHDLWQVIKRRQESAFLDDQPMYAQYLLTRHVQTDEKLMVLFWYLWDDPQRDSRDGVLSMRVNVFLLPGQTEEAALAHAWEFVRLLFPSTVPWERF